MLNADLYSAKVGRGFPPKTKAGNSALWEKSNLPRLETSDTVYEGWKRGEDREFKQSNKEVPGRINIGRFNGMSRDLYLKALFRYKYGFPFVGFQTALGKGKKRHSSAFFPSLEKRCESSGISLFDRFGSTDRWAIPRKSEKVNLGHFARFSGVHSPGTSDSSNHSIPPGRLTRPLEKKTQREINLRAFEKKPALKVFYAREAQCLIRNFLPSSSIIKLSIIFITSVWESSQKFDPAPTVSKTLRKLTWLRKGRSRAYFELIKIRRSMVLTLLRAS